MENISFKVPEPSEYSKVLEAFEDYFIKHEPGLTSLGGYPDGLSQENKEYRTFLEEGVSVIAIDKTNDLICGTMLSMMFTRENDSMNPKPTFDYLKEKFSEKHAKIEVLCNDAIHPSDFFESFKDSNKFVDINAIGVHGNYQRKGIATKLGICQHQKSDNLQYNTLGRWDFNIIWWDGGLTERLSRCLMVQCLF